MHAQRYNGNGLTKMIVRLADITDAIQNIGLKAEIYRFNTYAWDSVWRELSYQPVAYARSMIDYQHAYLQSAGWDVQDISLIIFNDNRPCAIWPLSLGVNISGKTCVTSAGSVVMAPMFLRGLSPKTIKRTCSNSIKFLFELCNKVGLNEIKVEQAVEPYRYSEGATEWYQQLMALNAEVSVKHDMFIDMTVVYSEIRAGFRKSYKPLINVGLRNWKTDVLEHSNVCEFKWNEFKALHCEVAGRVTRSDHTWSLQLAMIASGDAFLVGLRSPLDDRLVGGGFFQCTRDEGLYAVAAYDRSLFDKPLGHVVQKIAIEKMKEMGLKWYKLGERFYQGGSSLATDKEITISSFKQGFASHMFFRNELKIPIELSKYTGPRK